MVARASFDTLRSLAAGSISGSYANIGTATTREFRAFMVNNATDGDLVISLDGGTTDHLFMPAGSFQLYDVGANAQQFDDKFVLPVGTQFAVKLSTAATTKSVYVSVLQ